MPDIVKLIEEWEAVANVKLRSAVKGAMWWGAAGLVSEFAFGRGPIWVLPVVSVMVGFIVGWAWAADKQSQP